MCRWLEVPGVSHVEKGGRGGTHETEENENVVFYTGDDPTHRSGRGRTLSKTRGPCRVRSRSSRNITGRLPSIHGSGQVTMTRPDPPEPGSTHKKPGGKKVSPARIQPRRVYSLIYRTKLNLQVVDVSRGDVYI